MFNRYFHEIYHKSIHIVSLDIFLHKEYTVILCIAVSFELRYISISLYLIKLYLNDHEQSWIILKAFSNLIVCIKIHNNSDILKFKHFKRKYTIYVGFLLSFLFIFQLWKICSKRRNIFGYLNHVRRKLF